MFTMKNMSIKLNKNILKSFFIIFLIIGLVFPKNITLEKVEDLRLEMIEKKNKRALIKLISIYKLI